MMATAEPPTGSSLLPLLESLEDSSAGQSEHTDAYLTIANRLSGEEGRQFLPVVEKHFPRLGKSILTHMTSPTAELSQAALQALGFCLYHSHVVSGVSDILAAEILSTLCSLVGKSTDKNTCTRALWVISKQSFPPDVVGKKVSSILETLENVLSREDIQSVVMEHEALNVIIRLLEQTPAQMGDGALRWAKLIIPLVVHSASKVRLRAAAAMEMGMPLLLEKQMEVAAIIEPIMSSKLIPELQKLFMSKNESNVLKLWPLFVKLLGKLLHRGGPFINSLLHLEELGFRSSSPTIKKIAFIAWKSLIDNFALNPAILCSAKRVKLLMQPLASINVRTEVLLLTKVEVWWYLVVQLGPNLSPIFDQVSAPLLQCTIGSDSSSVQGTPSRAVSQNGAVPPATPKTAGLSSPAPRMSLNGNVQIPTTFPSIQLLGLEMLLHYFLGPEVIATAAKKKLVLSLEPLNHPLLSGASSFTKHAAVLTSSIRDGFTNTGKDAPDSLLAVIWTSLVRFVNLTVESGSKKDRQGGEVLTLMLQALQSIVESEALPADKVLILFEATVKGIPQRVLGSASYQVGKMDVLNGTPALFLILLLFNSSMLSAYMEDERFFQCLQTLVGCGLSGPTSPLAFGEAVLGAIKRSSESVQNKEQLWRMWSVMVNPLTDTITQSNEVNQGDALEHNFSAMHSALLFPITHLLHGTPLQQASQKLMLSSWSKLYKVFARCSALVVTAEENICCEELCMKMTATIDREALTVPSTLNAVASILQVMVECVDFSPYTPQFQQKLKSPHTPVNWMRKKNKVLGNLSTFQSLLGHCLEVYLEDPEASAEATGLALISILSAIFANLALANTVKEALTSLVQPLAIFYKQAASEPPKLSSQLVGKLEKLVGDVLGCLQTRCTFAYDDELLASLSPLLCVLFPNKNKHLRTSVTHFWNSTFANSVSLVYPDEIRPILSQVKQKTPIILPGFEAISVPDELSGPYSSESSQLETKLSGMPVSVGKRDSLLGKAAELKDKKAATTSKSVSTKLDFGSPKPPHRGVLEEEASIDFVFIPPETKERVLTEHQKEVKRTKRVDIPAMYNNLDASLDTTVFTQYTQSQEDSLDKLATEQADKATKEAPGKIPVEDKEEEATGVLTEETQDNASPKASEDKPENHKQEEIVPESADVSMEDDAKVHDGAEDLPSKDGISPNMSGSSDLVSGTPQKPNSRRQSFITLEKYAEGKPASPSNASTFTGPLIKTSNSQQHSKNNTSSSSPASQTSTSPNSQDSQSSQTGKVLQCPVNDALESPVRPKESGIKSVPVRLTERLPSDPTEDEDVIPDTQTEVEGKKSPPMKASSQEEESEEALNASQSSETPPGKPRRSGRSRVRPLLPGEEPEECEEKYTVAKRRRSGDEQVQSRRSTRSMQAAEEDGGRDRLRTRAQRDKSEPKRNNSQGTAHKKAKLNNTSEHLLDKPEPKRRSIRGSDSSQTDSQSDHESQSQGRQRRQGTVSMEAKEEGTIMKKAVHDKEESSQTTEHVDQDEKDGKLKKDSQVITPSPQKDDQLKMDSQIVASSPQTGSKSQEVEFIEKRDSQVIASPTGVESQKTEKTSEDMDGNLSQDDSQVITPSSSDSQSLRRSRRSKASEVEPEGQSESQGPVERQSRSNSQAALAVGPTEARGGGRTRRSKVQEELSKLTPGSTTESSQLLETTGSTESSQGRGRYSRRRSLPEATKEPSDSESSGVKEVPTSKRGRRKTRASLPSPLTIESEEGKINNDVVKEDSQESQDLQGSESLQVESQMEVEVAAVVDKTETDDTKNDLLIVSPRKEEEVQNVEKTTSQESDHEDSAPAEVPSGDTTEKLQESEEKAEETSEPDDDVAEKQEDGSNSNHTEHLVEDASDDFHSRLLSKDEELVGSTKEDDLADQHTEANAGDIEPLQESDKDRTCQDGQEAQDNVAANLDAPLADVDDASALPESTSKDVSADSPAKQKDLEALMGAEAGQSPSGRTRGTWSPSASPSTSILKKGLKRPLEEEATSPLIKSRRVSFANPIQHQEIADDIDRRSPALRTSSPRRSKVSSLPQPKYVTTPTKGLLVLSPRNLHSPGYKSSKKCLISEMSQESRPVSKDCIYPALVGCSAPVEAVLPQISSNMWSRGFGQLVRARNIKTVGDLSALTASEIKTLPIRSPKISNVKKALKSYEQQRKGRGVDELKSFDEMEMMTSELEETSAPQNLDEEDKTSGETLATELVDEPVPADVKSEDQVPGMLAEEPGPGGPGPGEPGPGEALHPEGLQSEVEALTCRMTPLELSYCSPQQLVQMHDHLGGMMRRVVVELQTRLCQTDAKP